ncbi:MAG: apolipoprotein N-acyltransferase [Alphaproteobacteria bacterium]|nr:apolipoprotein N-acyltransferase [Alphaproteobacteria bacterium]
MFLVSGVANRLRALQGWKRNGTAFALGVCLTLAFPPFWILILAIFAFSGLLWLLEGATSTRSAFKTGWWFGFGHHITGLYWICIALGVDGGAFLWFLPFALCVLPAYLSLFIGLATALSHRFRRKPIEQVFVFALFWLVAEYVRAHLFYGFPWNLTGYIWTMSDQTLQPASLIGIYGLSLWAVIFGAAFSLLAQPNSRGQKQATRGFIYIMLVTFIMVGWGQLRLSNSEHHETPASGVRVRLVQASVAQTLKWDPEFQMLALQRHINLSKRIPHDGVLPDYIIWPETAMPFRIEEGTQWTQTLAEIAPKTGALITGAVRTEGNSDDWQVWNSLRAIDASGHVALTYDKTVLVPFGEFIPLRSVLSFLPVAKITQGAKDFSVGGGAQLLSLPGDAPAMQPLICYETIFSGYRPDDDSTATGWLLNITNDAWFGTSTGPYQHLQMSRTRAVERGAPMVRVANTGVSAVFDAYGRTIGKIALNEQGVLDADLPGHLAVPTWYSRYGEFTLIIICYILFIFAFNRRSKIT